MVQSRILSSRPRQEVQTPTVSSSMTISMMPKELNNSNFLKDIDSKEKISKGKS